MTLLERFDRYGMTYGILTTSDRMVMAHEIRRAIAIAQAVEEFQRSTSIESSVAADCIVARADELLEGR